MRGGNGFDEVWDTPTYTISAAATLAAMHPQTLRQYDRLGLVKPSRTPGGGRRYSLRNIATLREVQRLSADDGVNLAGIKRILALEGEVEQLRRELDAAQTTLGQRRVFHADAAGNIISMAQGTRSARMKHGAVVVWRGQSSSH